MIHIHTALIFLLTGGATAAPFTYQGKLFADSEPASGLLDFEFRLFDAPTEGNQIGSLIMLDDHPVADGLVNTSLDFGDVFDSTELYLEISIREGDSEDAFDRLLPRQQVTPAPKAIHASTADAISGPGWTLSDDGGEQVLWFGTGSDRVLINRSKTITGTEYFGIHTENSPVGGMVISNSDPDAITLLTYAPGGTPRASELFNGLTDAWALQIDQDIILTANAQRLTAPAYEYSAPKSGAVTIAGDVFHSALGTPFRASFFGGGAYLSTAGDNAPMVAPVTLPNGARVTKMTARFEDNAVSHLTVTLMGAQADESLLSIGTTSTEGFPQMPGLQSSSTVEIDMAGSIINTLNTGYYLRVFSSSWPGDSSLRIWSVTIEYTVNAPD